MLLQKNIILQLLVISKFKCSILKIILKKDICNLSMNLLTDKAIKKANLHGTEK